MKSGILSSLRKKGIDVYNDKYIKVRAAEEWKSAETDHNMCGYSWIKDGNASFVFDGDLNTAYAQKEGSSTNFKNVSIEFNKFPIFINSYSIKTVCCTPREIIVDGSNDSSHWTVIDHVTNTLAENAISTFACDNPGTFRIIRFTQIGSSTCGYNYRFHLAEIELYGYILKRCTQSHKKKQGIVPMLLVMR